MPILSRPDKRFNRQISWTSLGAFICLATLAADSGKPSLAQSDEISIAVAGPMTGDLAAFGEQLRRGAEAAVSDLNAAGGVLGKHIKLEVLDDRCDPAVAAQVAEELVHRGVVLVAGHFCSSSSIAAMDVYGKYDVLMITPSSMNPVLTERASEMGFRTVFRTVARYDNEGAVAGTWIADEYAGKRVAVLSDESTYGLTLAEETQASLKAAKLNAELRATYSEKERDFSKLISQLKDEKIDVVYAGGYAPSVALFVRQAREQGFEAEVVASDDLVSAEFWKIAGSAGEGVQFLKPDPETDSPSAKAVIEKLRTQDFMPEGYTLNSYAAVQAWAAAAEEAGSTEGSAVAEILRRYSVATVLGDLTWDSKGDLENPSYAVYQWTEGRTIAAARLRCPPHCGKEKPTPKQKPLLKPKK